LIAVPVAIAVAVSAIPPAASATTRVVAWGANEAGQLGNGTETAASRPVTVKNLENVTAISAGFNFSAAVAGSAGEVMTWGSNREAQLGDGKKPGEQAKSLTPVSVCTGEPECKPLTNVKAIAASLEQGVAVVGENREVMTWGENTYEQLGDGRTPAEQPYSASAVHVCMTAERECKEENYLKGVIAVADGGGHDLALTSNGEVLAWGRNEVKWWELGDGTTTNSDHAEHVCTTERKCNEEGEAGKAYYLTNVKAITAGAYDSFALLNDGTVVGWGGNEHGDLGDGETEAGTYSYAAHPVHVCTEGTCNDPTEPHHYLEHVLAVAAHSGSSTTLAVKEGGEVVGWGRDYYGQIGDGTHGGEYDHPVRTLGITEGAAAAEGEDHSLARLTNGAVLAFGRNSFGQLGTGGGTGGTSEKYDRYVPVEMLNETTAIAAGKNFSLAIQQEPGPEFVSNGNVVGAAMVPTFVAGEVTLEDNLFGKLQCRLAGTGNLWNEAERGRANIESLLAYPCRGESESVCRGMALMAETTSSPPWAAQELHRATVEGVTVHKLRMPGMSFKLIDPCTAIETVFEGMLDPKLASGLSIRVPARLEFSAESGQLTGTSLPPDPLSLTGGARPIKLVGESMQVITATE
jgi:alpha-tubulin suppressor-like RCC1 family protein